jgi:hypothetical protein
LEEFGSAERGQLVLGELALQHLAHCLQVAELGVADVFRGYERELGVHLAQAGESLLIFLNLFEEMRFCTREVVKFVLDLLEFEVDALYHLDLNQLVLLEHALGGAQDQLDVGLLRGVELDDVAVFVFLVLVAVLELEHCEV